MKMETWNMLNWIRCVFNLQLVLSNFNYFIAYYFFTIIVFVIEVVYEVIHYQFEEMTTELGVWKIAAKGGKVAHKSWVRCRFVSIIDGKAKR